MQAATAAHVTLAMLHGMRHAYGYMTHARHRSCNLHVGMHACSLVQAELELHPPTAADVLHGQ
jgi:hypothetical protein